MSKTIEQIREAMSEDECAMLENLEKILREGEAQRLKEQLESQAERNLKIDMLERMDKSAIGEAFLYYTKTMKYPDIDDLGITSDDVLEAYSLICRIIFLDMYYC